MKVFIASHMPYEFPNSQLYVPIQVGSVLNRKIPGMLYDDTEDNISEKNPYYCELTALYWMWKNCNENIIGLVHYRRYFSSLVSELSIHNQKILDENELSKLMNEVDLILPVESVFGSKHKNVFCHYRRDHYIKDLLALREIIGKRHNDYLTSFDKVMKHTSLYSCNMFIAKKQIVDSYCEWLFDVLFTLEKTIVLKGYSVYQQRVFGFLSERLFNIWFEKNKEIISFKKIDVINIEARSREEKMVSKKKKTLPECLKRAKDRLSMNVENKYRILKNKIYLLNKESYSCCE